MGGRKVERHTKWSITASKFLTAEQIEALLAYLTNHRDLGIARRLRQPIWDYYIVRTMLESGLRVFEFCALTNADLVGQRLTVCRGKGNKPRTVLLTRASANMMKEWLRVKERFGFDSTIAASPLFPSRYGRIYTTRAIQKRIKSIFAFVGLPKHLSAHSLRHTYCSLLLASQKVGIGTVRDNMGHHSLTVTNLYVHAIGSIEDVELYATPSSEKTVFSEPQRTTAKKKPKSIVEAFLRKTNLK